VRLLAILEERMASPRELAPIVRAPLGTVAYHVRTLHQLGLVKLVKRTSVRGAVQHHYRALERPRFSDEAWAGAAPVAKQALVGAMVQQSYEYVRASAAAGGFDRADAHMTRTALKLDKKGWDQLTRACRKLLQEVEKIEESVQARQEDGSTEEPQDVGVVLMMFEASRFSDRPRAESGARDHYEEHVTA
jgi:hypothetical protein